MWLDDFQRAGVTPLIPYDPKPVMDTGKQDVVSNERNCFSCHDGYIIDSRFVWENKKYSHPVGVVPSEKVKLPTANEARLRPEDNLFPLNSDGKVYCGTCHSAHGVNWKQKESPVFLRAKNIDSSFCLNCHEERGSGPAEGNHPVSRKLDPIPEDLLDAGSKFGKESTVICQSCHRVHGGRDEKLLVVSNDGSALCGQCHNDRYAKSRAESGRMGTHPVNIVSDKVEIPEEVIDKGGKLGNKGEIICQTCHRPHYAEKNATLLVKNNQNSSLCQTCHIKERNVTGSKHNIILSDGQNENIRGEKVGKSGVCSACHLPHGGRGPKMWARSVKNIADPVSNLCLSCHSSGRIAEKKQVGKHSHPLGRAMSKLGQGVKLPGYEKSGQKSVGDKKGMVTCASCHNPHQWDPNDPDKGAGPDDFADAGNKFLRVSNSGTESPLCRTCHLDKGSVLGTKHDRANMNDESVERGSICGTCHRAHNGKGLRMWARKPAEGGDAITSLCLSCHNPNGVGKEKTVGDQSHPVAAPIGNIGIVVTSGDWRSEKAKGLGSEEIKPLPLFDSQGRKVYNEGQVMCATCHDPHKWSLHSESGGRGELEEGDGESSFLRIPNGSDAALCANCHVDKKTVAFSKHNLATSAPEEKDSQGAVCLNCHLPHNGYGPLMWAREPGSGADRIASLCQSCHQENGVAGEKLTGENSHPLQVGVDAIGGGRTKLPLFDVDGVRRSSKNGGGVSCSTCHNVHQWDPKNAGSKEGASSEIEGTARNSFLRIPASGPAELCADCHRDQRWVLGTDHDLRVTAPQEVNARGFNAEEAGVCQQCHSVHNAEQALRIWARRTGEGQDLNERMCRGCHAEGKAAEAKIPVKKSHPAQVQAQILRARARRGPVRGFTPLFDEEGRPANTGVISCPTCHNPHRWDAVAMDKGPGKNLEGNARNSFLRNRSKLSLCSNCHGMDALFRYKYFHGETSRKKHKLYR